MADRPFNPPPSEVAVPWDRVERFVGQLTHDVRNGLNALELQLTYLGEISVDPEAAAETKRLRASLSEITRALQAIRISTSPPSPNAMDYPAGDFFADLRERYERTQKGAVTWDIAAGDALLAIDPELTMGALLELLANAQRFKSEFVTVAARESDTGSFLAFTLLERKAESDPPVDTVGWGCEPLRSTRRSDYGLGLFRATRVVEAQGGTIAASFSDHTLTTSVTLPLAARA